MEWINVVADGDHIAFDQRFFSGGQGIAHARQLLTQKPIPSELPRWIDVLEDVLLTLSGEPGQDGKIRAEGLCTFLRPEAPVPFEEALLPLIEVARKKVAAATDGRYGLLAMDVSSEFERRLLQKLSAIAARPLLVEFRTFSACRQLSPTLPDRSPAQSPSRDNYLCFIEDTRTNGWQKIFREYPVLARLLAASIMNWVAATASFLLRLEQDMREIQRIFFAGEEIGNLVEVRSALSDPHDKGGTVCALKFRSGAHLIYKPKSLSLDAAFFRFLAWLNERGAPLSFICPKILDRGNYGWLATVDHLPCNNDEEIRRFYQRLGMFLGIAYVMNAVDFHHENIIACGEHPVPIDLETIYHPVQSSTSIDEDPIAEKLRQSVLRTDILPNPVKFLGDYYDISAVGHRKEGMEGPKAQEWRYINTDKMSVAVAGVHNHGAQSLPRLDTQVVDPREYISALTRGFQEIYLFLVRERVRLLEGGSFFRQIFNFSARFLLRSTAFYQSVLNKSLHPRYLRSGTDFSIQLDVLSRMLMTRPGAPTSWPIVRAEADSLVEGDIPKFTTYGCDRSLTLPSGVVLRNFFAASAWETVAQKLLALEEEDLQWQIRLIESAMGGAAQESEPPAVHGPEQAHENDAAQLPTADELLQCAIDLAERIKYAAVYGNGQEPSWLVLNFVPEIEQFAPQPIGLDLYNGRCGLSLFFAALERCAPGRGYGNLSYAALAPVRRWLAKPTQRGLNDMGLGGLLGYPSMIYALVRIGAFLGDDELLVEASRATRLITSAQINADTRLDLMGGVAGTILSLLACESDSGSNTEMIEKAIACGHHLLARREADRCGKRTWATFDKRHLTGIAHGAGGIAYSLLRLFEKTGEPAFFTAAREAVEFEDAEFVPEEDNWPDRRPLLGKLPAGPEPPAFKVAWCSGAPGIALARLGALHLFDTLTVRRDITAALRTICRTPLLSRDHICCGNLGLVETLLQAGLTLSERKWIKKATALAAQVRSRARRQGSFNVSAPNAFFNPTLFQGAAGVGYEFMRLARPEEFPSTLLLE